MGLQIGTSWTDEHGRRYMELIDSNDIAYIYTREKKMWTTRGLSAGKQYPDHFVQRVVESQLPDYSKPGFTTICPLLDKVVEAKRQNNDNNISIVEIGAANGPTVRHFEKFYPDVNLRFFGMEALGFLADDAAAKHPSHQFTQGTAEDFVELTSTDLGHDHFDLFLASGTLCMLLPNLARAVLSKAGEIADAIVCREYLANKSGEISQDRPVMFELAPNHEHVLFANPYDVMLHDLGFSSIEYVYEDLDEIAVRGTGSFLARRPDISA